MIRSINRKSDPPAKASALKPYAYLKRVFAELPATTTVAEIETLLPWNVPRLATRLGEAERRSSAAA